MAEFSSAFHAPSSEQESSDNATRVCGSTWSTWLNHDTNSSLLTSTWGLEGKQQQSKAQSSSTGMQVNQGNAREH
jgi:hypothetical protein